MGPDGHCYICNNGGFSWRTDEGFTRPTGEAADYAGGCIQRVNLATGEVETLYTHCDGIALRGPNDIVFDAQGGFWFSDFGKKFADRLMHGAVYYARTDGTLIRRAAFPVLTPNGIGLSPDGGTLYLAETETSRLWSYPVIRPGELKLQPFPSPNGGTLVHGLPGYQRFDSLAVEEGGNICVATLVRGGISVFSPKRRTARVPRGSRRLLHQPVFRRPGQAHGLHHSVGLRPTLCGALAETGSTACCVTSSIADAGDRSQEASPSATISLRCSGAGDGCKLDGKNFEHATR